VADLDAGQQARERRSIYYRANRSGYGRCVGKKKRQLDVWSRTQRFALRRFLDFLGEALREATVF
jgi:hypothetical protein